MNFLVLNIWANSLFLYRTDAKDGSDRRSQSPDQESSAALQTFVFSATLSRDLQQNLTKRKRSNTKRGDLPSSTLGIVTLPFSML